MPYNEQLADRVRERFAELDNVKEIAMMGGRCFMYNDKMCAGVLNDDLLCRIDPAIMEHALEQPGCREIDFGRRPMKSFVLVDETITKTNKGLDHWINLCLDFNIHVKSSKRK